MLDIILISHMRRAYNLPKMTQIMKLEFIPHLFDTKVEYLLYIPQHILLYNTGDEKSEEGRRQEFL